MAERIKADERATRILLNHLASVHLVRTTTIASTAGKSETIYSIGAAARTHLVKDSTDFVGSFVTLFATDSFNAKLRESTAIVTQGGTHPHSSHDGMTTKLGSNEHDFWTTFAQETVAISRNPAEGLATFARGLIKSDSTAFTQVLDVACGTGTYGLTVARQFPGANLTLQDQDNVLPHTAAWVDEFGIATSRIAYLNGSIFDVDLPNSTYDLIIVSHFLHHFDYQTNIGLLKRLANALARPDGVLIVNEMTRAEGDYGALKPTFGYQFGFVMLLSTEKGQTYSVTEIEHMMKEAGLIMISNAGDFPLPNTYVSAVRAAK